MTENMKKFLEEASKNKDLLEKARTLSKEDLPALAKELGIALTEADLEASEGELSEKELSGVAGGGECWCVVGGGGTESGDGTDEVCACVALGFGTDNTNYARCNCYLGGYGV